MNVERPIDGSTTTKDVPTVGPKPAGQPADHRDRRLYVWWTISLGLLALIGAFSFFVLRPCLEVRAVAAKYDSFIPYELREGEAANLGGSRAAWKLGLYLRLPERLAPGKLAALQLLGGCGPVATPRLIAYVNHPGRDMRQAAIEGLGATGDPRAFGPLAAALADRSGGLRAEAAGALGALRDPRAVGLLITVLSDQDREVRGKAAYALGELQDCRAFESLAAALNDREFDVRATAAGALGLLKDRRAVEPLVAAMKDDSNAWAREHAVEALRAIGDPHAIGPLIAALEDSNHDVRGRAARALGDFDDPRILPALVAMLGRERPPQDEQEALWIMQTTMLSPAAEARAAIRKQRAKHPEWPEPEPEP